MAAEAVAEVDRLTDLALALPPALRELVAYRIWESLHSGESWPLSAEQLNEIRTRVAEIDDGKVKPISGDDALRSVRARIENHRR